MMKMNTLCFESGKNSNKTKNMTQVTGLFKNSVVFSQVGVSVKLDDGSKFVSKTRHKQKKKCFARLTQDD